MDLFLQLQPPCLLHRRSNLLLRLFATVDIPADDVGIGGVCTREHDVTSSVEPPQDLSTAVRQPGGVLRADVHGTRTNIVGYRRQQMNYSRAVASVALEFVASVALMVVGQQSVVAAGTSRMECSTASYRAR